MPPRGLREGSERPSGRASGRASGSFRGAPRGPPGGPPGGLPGALRDRHLGKGGARGGFSGGAPGELPGGHPGGVLGGSRVTFSIVWAPSTLWAYVFQRFGASDALAVRLCRETLPRYDALTMDINIGNRKRSGFIACVNKSNAAARRFYCNFL